MGWKEILCLLLLLVIGLACIGFLLPGELLLYLVGGWAFYSYRVLPQVAVNWSAVVSVVICLVLLAAGLHHFLRWLTEKKSETVARRWRFRWTATSLAVVILMFISGIAAVGVTHQTAWLVTSPEPIVQSGKDTAARIISSNNLKQIVLAMHNHSVNNHHRLPAHAIYDTHGTPLLSWRVLILPYVEEEILFKQFKLDEAWDSPHNLRLLPRIPPVYAPPPRFKSSALPGHTFYQVFIGPGKLLGRWEARPPATWDVADSPVNAGYRSAISHQGSAPCDEP
jgi:hypothetical protein